MSYEQSQEMVMDAQDVATLFTVRCIFGAKLCSFLVGGCNTTIVCYVLISFGKLGGNSAVDLSQNPKSKHDLGVAQYILSHVH